MLKPILTVLAFVATLGPALAVDLPPICKTNAAQVMAMGDGGMMVMGTPDAAHKDLMAGMAQMNSDMMVGGTADDIDVAFVCSMIPHHAGAIDMAKAELAHGDDPWVKEMAQKVIDAQTKEIADMLDWLARQSK